MGNDNLQSNGFDCCMLHPEVTDHEGPLMIARTQEKLLGQTLTRPKVTFRNNSMIRLENFKVSLSGMNHTTEEIFQRFLDKFLAF